MVETAKDKVVEEVDGVKRIFINPDVTKEEYAQLAESDPVILEALVTSLDGEARRVRQFSATIRAQVAHSAPEILAPNIDSLCDALHRPEAQTRWNVLEALYELAPICLDECVEAIPGAEVSLYDEDSGLVRLAAFRFMCRMGESDADASERVWPFLDEAIQCYHGDPEFNEMLDELIRFARGSASSEIKQALADRMAFDAKSAKGGLQKRAKVIVEACGE